MSDTLIRVDVLVCDKGFATSREKAKEYISEGKIYINGKKETKAGRKIDENSDIEFKGEVIPYVSRGGLKLEKAIKQFEIELKDKICLDIGASTGGFTHCMLENGASKVYAIDVGHDQLVRELRENPKVISMEGVNIRYVTNDDIGELCDFASIDVSFISLEKVIPAVSELLNENGTVVALIKPQFEVGRGKVNKKGVVKKEEDHINVLLKIVALLEGLNLKVEKLDYSPIKGPNGNIEYLINFKKSKNEIDKSFDIYKVSNLVKEAHSRLSLEEV